MLERVRSAYECCACRRRAKGSHLQDLTESLGRDLRVSKSANSCGPEIYRLYNSRDMSAKICTGLKKQQGQSSVCLSPGASFIPPVG